MAAIDAGTQAAFETVQLGGGNRLLANPLNAYSLQLDSNGTCMAPAPAFDIRNTAVVWSSATGWHYAGISASTSTIPAPLIAATCNDLNQLGFEREFGFYCTPQTIFRGPYDGCDIGPHVSQFSLKDFLCGNQPIQQQQLYPQEGLDYLTDLDTWTRVNNGDIDPTGSDTLVGTRYISTLRDAGQWVHVDFPHQSSLWATITLLGQQAMLTAASPYANGSITTSNEFGSLGGPDITIQSGLAAVYGLKHAWFQKWCIHRRLRPEVYSQRLELFRRGILGHPFNDTFNTFFGAGAEVWKQTCVLDRIFKHNQDLNRRFCREDEGGTWLLPIAFPEGSPTHPSYPGGHSAFIAAGATVAKAFFADGVIANPQVPRVDGQDLSDSTDAPLTIHGELNKLCQRDAIPQWRGYALADR